MPRKPRPPRAARTRLIEALIERIMESIRPAKEKAHGQ